MLAILASAVGLAGGGSPSNGGRPPLPDLRDLLAPPAGRGVAQGMAPDPGPRPDPAGDPVPGVAALLPALAMCDLAPAAAPLPAVLLSALVEAVARDVCRGGHAGQHAGGQGGPHGDSHAAPAMPGGAVDTEVDRASSAAGQPAVSAGAAEQPVEAHGQSAAAEPRNCEALQGPAALAALGEACMSGGGGEPDLAPCAAWTPRLAALVLALLLSQGVPALQGSNPDEGLRHALLQLLRKAVCAQMGRVPARLARALACADAVDAAALRAAVRPLQVRSTICPLHCLHR